MTSRCLVLLTLCASAASAATTVRLLPPNTWSPERAAAPTKVAAFSPAAGTSALLAVPWFEVDTTDASGRTTLLALRNESAATTTLSVRYWNQAGTESRLETVQLAPKATWTRNLRDIVVGNLPADIDGTVRGWARVDASGGAQISHDVFFVDPGGNFAGGDNLADPTADFCAAARGRFLSGGAFSGGTRFLAIVDLPLGADENSDPPTITGTAYSEAGTPLNNFEIYTDFYALEIPVSDVVAGGTPFGSVDMNFESAGLDGLFGGNLIIESNAEERYSVTYRGTCLP